MTEPLRIATFNCALNRPAEGGLAAELAGPGSDQLRAVVEVIRHLDADILVLNELDRDAAGHNLDRLAERWLRPAGLDYPHRFCAPVNTGLASGRDLVKDGRGEITPFGFGAFAGQYGLAVLSRRPIDTAASRTFQRFLWRDLPGAALPRHRDGSAFFDAGDRAVLRLSSKSHWDLVIAGPAGPFHLLVSHPTPPAFDGPEKRNAHRNNDEIRFWLEYLADGRVRDDQGRAGGLSTDAPFVIAGDLNADPRRGDGLGAIRELLAHPAIRDPAPTSPGARQRWPDDPGPADQTADWGLRADYLLPSRHWRLDHSAVLWPTDDAPLAEAVRRASDHRAVVLEVALAG